MLSKKMTVSLMSLIAIFAFAFVAPIATAASFRVVLSEHADQPDIGAAPGLQVERMDPLKVKVTFGEFVNGADVMTNASVGGFDMKGNYIPDVVVNKVDPADKDARDFTIEIKTTDATVKVTLQIMEDIAAANAFSTNMSAELLEDIILYDSDVDIAPRVYGIRRADNSALPVSSGAVNVIITLSEEPESFTMAHINVMGGTAGMPVALGAIPQNAVGLSQFASHIDKPEVKEATLEQIRDGIFKTGDDGNARDEYDLKGIEYYVSTVADVGGLPEDGGTATTEADYAATFTGDDATRKEFRAEIMALETALGDADSQKSNQATTGFMYHWVKDNHIQTAVLEHGDVNVATDTPPGPNNVKAMPIVDNVLQEPTKWATETAVSGSELTGTHGGVTVTIAAEEFDRSSKPATHKDGEKAPKAGDFTTVDAFNFAMAAYNARTGATANAERDAYTAEKKVYDAYKALQDAIAKNRMEQRADWQESLIMEAAEGTTTQIAENVLPPTGRDGMLHPYSVAITPSYTTDTTVVKVNRWQNAASDPGVYKPPVLEAGYTEGFDKLTISVTPAAAAAAAVQPSGVIVYTVPAGIFK